MARRHHYRRRLSEATELDVTTFLNLMVVLVPFLLITAVFSQVAIVELDMPTASGKSSPVEPGFRVEVMVRDSGLEIGNGRAVIARIPKLEDEYDLATLRDYLFDLKREHPDVTRASVLLEPAIAYDYLIQVMDIVRSAEVRDHDASPAVEETQDMDALDVDPALIAKIAQAPTRLELFPEISVGEAP